MIAQALQEVTGFHTYSLSAPINALKGVSFWWRALRCALSRKGCPIDNMPETIPTEIYICGPIWAGDMAGPLKNFVHHANLNGVTVHCALTGMQPSEQNRTAARKLLQRAGAQVGHVLLIATTKTPPEKALIVEHLKELMQA